MRVYRTSKSQPFKWLLALIVFIIAMGVTFNDVYGFDTNDEYYDNSETFDDQYDNSGSAGGDDGFTDTQGMAAPTAVPEPGTLILLGSGLTGMYLARKRRRSNKKK